MLEGRDNGNQSEQEGRPRGTNQSNRRASAVAWLLPVSIWATSV